MSSSEWPPAAAQGPDSGLFSFEPPSGSLPPPPAEPVRRTFSGGWFVLVILLALIVAGAGAYLAIHPGRLNAIPGQCVGREGGVIAVVECSTPGSYRVVGVVDVDARPATTMNPCNGRYRVTKYFWQGNPDGSGQVFCLGPQ